MNTPNTIIYARFSPRPTQKRNSIEDGETIEHQIEVCQKYCTMRNLNVAEIISDPLESARKTPVFERTGGAALKSIPQNISHIVAAKIDRLFRNTIDGLQMLQRWDAQNITVHFADQGGNSINVGTAMGRLMVRTFLSHAEFEADITSERTAAMMQHRQSNGEIMTRRDRIPYGFKIDNHNDRLVPCPAEQQLIQHVATLRNQGRSLREICKVMDAMGVKIRDAAWHPQTVARLVECAKEMGE